MSIILCSPPKSSLCLIADSGSGWIVRPHRASLALSKSLELLNPQVNPSVAHFDSLCVPKLHPCRSSGRPLLVEDATETILSTYCEAIDPFSVKGLGQGLQRCCRAK
jgi:hypothetical protein